MLLGACAGGERARTEGIIDATSAQPLPPAGALSLAPEDGRADATLEQAAGRAMGARGYQIAEGAALRLSYRLGFGPGEPPRRSDIAVGGVIGSSGTRDVGIGIGLPIMNWFGPRATRFTLAATLRQGEAVLWQGWITGETREEDAGRAARATLPLLLDHLGETVRAQRFSLP